MINYIITFFICLNNIYWVIIVIVRAHFNESMEQVAKVIKSVILEYLNTLENIDNER